MAFAFAAAITVFAATLILLAYCTLRQYGRILLRLDAIEQSLILIQTRIHPKSEPASVASGVRRFTDGATSRIGRDGLARGTVAPAFTLSSALANKQVSLSDCAGPLVLAFSDLDCEPCKELYAWLNAIEPKDPLPVLLIVRGSEQHVQAVQLPERSVTFPPLLQSGWNISRRYEIFKVPAAYVIDANGVIASSVAVGLEAVKSAILSLSPEATVPRAVGSALG